MSKIVSARDLAGFTQAQWVVPPDGFEWRTDLEPLHADGDGPWLVAKGAILNPYVLSDRGRLAAEFRRLAPEADQDAILGFADRRGLLGSISRALRPRHTTGSIRTDELAEGESLADWQRAIREFALSHAIFMDVATVDARESTGPVHVGDARHRLRAAVRRPPAGVTISFDPWSSSTGLTGFRWLAGATSDPELTHLLRSADSTDVARFYVASQVNQRLADVHPAVLPFRGSVMRSFPVNLEAAIYLWLGQRMGTGMDSALPERPCENCGDAFVPWRRDARYCSDRCRWDAARHRRARRPG